MSRLIKDFGYNEDFNESVTVSADEIEAFSNSQPFCKDYIANISHDFNEEIFDFNVSVRAFEDKPGVEITVSGHKRENPKIYTGSIVVDEIEFVDELYKVISGEKTGFFVYDDIETKFIARAFNETVGLQLSAEGYWFYSPKRKEWYKVAA